MINPFLCRQSQRVCVFFFVLYCRPRLGTTLHRVLGVGALYFILATVEGCFRSLHVSLSSVSRWWTVLSASWAVYYTCSPVMSLMFPAGWQLAFAGGLNLFEINSPIKKLFSEGSNQAAESSSQLVNLPVARCIDTL